MTSKEYKYLYTVNSPKDLKLLTVDQLIEYNNELRQFIIDQLSRNPGHLASSLGTIELTSAIHYVYDTPKDKLVWDVGHQAYAHKIMTGRRDRFETNRKLGGLSGFPKMEESPYDAFGGGHSSTSISAALGIATAARLNGESIKSIAVIGDGAMTGGLAFEGLNNAGAMKEDILVILNDNNMSIDRNVGALNSYLLNITTSAKYNNLKQTVWNKLSIAPYIRKSIGTASSMIKQGLLHQSNLFESFGFRYFGPIDGHNTVGLTKTLQDLKSIKGPKLLHVITQKGRGYTPAEENQSVWHAPGRFDSETGKRLVKRCDISRYQDVFGETMIDLANLDSRVIGVTPAMPSGCSLNLMIDKMPNRCFDVGIAEGHAVTFSAGTAAAGSRPFCNIYSSFMQRAYDNVIHDIAIQNLPVTMCLDRGGIVGEDGATHHGLFDIAYFRLVPNLTIASPLNELELRNMMYSALKSDRPFVIRYPRGLGEGVDWRHQPFEQLPIGESRILRNGSEVALLTLGTIGNVAAKAAHNSNRDVLHIDMRYAKPLDEKLLHMIGTNFERVITVEDGTVIGGLGSGVGEFFARHNYKCNLHIMGTPDCFVEHGTPSELMTLCGIDYEGILSALNYES